MNDPESRTDDQRSTAVEVALRTAGPFLASAIWRLLDLLWRG